MIKYVSRGISLCLIKEIAVKREREAEMKIRIENKIADTCSLSVKGIKTRFWISPRSILNIEDD